MLINSVIVRSSLYVHLCQRQNRDKFTLENDSNFKIKENSLFLCRISLPQKHLSKNYLQK